MVKYEGVKDRVSVVTPVYNGERYLHRLLQSILSQSWDNIEMILVDDGSQDRTVEIAQHYRDQFRTRGFIFEIISTEHRNASAAINCGLPLVTGEFLIWPDSDDELEPDSICKRVNFLRMHPQYQCVRSLSRYRYEDGTCAPQQETRGCLEEERLFFPILMGETFVCCGCYMLCCAPFFDIYPQRWIPEYDVGQNFQMLLPFMYRYPCPTIQEELYTVYVRADSHSHRKLTQQEDEKRYVDFESLADEIFSICAITIPEELLQLKRWKWRRRRMLYLRYNQKWKARIARFWLFCYGE